MKMAKLLGIILILSAGISFGVPHKEIVNTNYYFSSIRSDDPNYFAYVIPKSDGNHTLDEEHAEFYISLKYPLFRTMWWDQNWYMPNRFLFIYNGMYDFYMFSDASDDLYGSAPIISRRQNPGLALEWDSAQRGQWRLGYFHESNGQSIDNMDDFNDTMNTSSNNTTYTLGQVSRGWDYLTLRYEFDTGKRLGCTKPNNSWFRFNIDLRHFFDFQGGGSTDKEDTIFWTTPQTQAKISEYDGLRTTLEASSQLGPKFWRFRSSEVLARLETKTGISDLEALENFGGRLTLAIKPAFFIKEGMGDRPFNTWISCFYFNGYGREPSSYHYRTEYIGIGIEMR